MSEVVNSLYRTFNPKYVHYQPDGSGRDANLIKNNGGLLRSAETNIGYNEKFQISSKKITFYSLRYYKS